MRRLVHLAAIQYDFGISEEQAPVFQLGRMGPDAAAAKKVAEACTYGAIELDETEREGDA